MDFSDTSSDELEEHNAWNPICWNFSFVRHIGICMEVLVDEMGELHSRVMLLLTSYAPCSMALLGAPLPLEKASIGLHPTLRPARLTQITEKIMKAIQIAVEQILTFSVPQVMEKGLQFVRPFSNRGGRPTFFLRLFHIPSRTRRRGSVSMCLL